MAAQTNITAQASLRYLQISPRKVRLVADMIRGKRAEDALNGLRFMSKACAKPLVQLLKSAVSNAEQQGADVDRLCISHIRVDGGPVLKRSMPRARGTATKILKRTSHVHIELSQQ